MSTSSSPLDRLSRMCEDLFGSPVSPATIQKIIVDADKSLDEFSPIVEQELLKAPLAHADETGIRVEGLSPGSMSSPRPR